MAVNGNSSSGSGRPKVKSGKVPVTLPEGMINYLDRLAGQGYLGSTRAEVAAYLLKRCVEQMLEPSVIVKDDQ